MAEDALKRLIYVDDEPHIRLLAETCLTRVGGFETKVFGSGNAFLEEGAAFAPQMVLLDVMMPELDGPETLLRMRANPALADLPVIFVTAKTRPAELERFRQLGALDIIAKPFKPLTLSDELRACWQKYRLALAA